MMEEKIKKKYQIIANDGEFIMNTDDFKSAISTFNEAVQEGLKCTLSRDGETCLFDYVPKKVE